MINSPAALGRKPNPTAPTTTPNVGAELPEFYELMEIPDTVPGETQLKSVANYVPGYDFHAVKARK